MENIVQYKFITKGQYKDNTTRNLMQMTHGFINLLDDAVKSVASKKDIGSLKKLFQVQSDMIKELELEITNLEKKVLQMKKPKEKNLMEQFPD